MIRNPRPPPFLLCPPPINRRGEKEGRGPRAPREHGPRDAVDAPATPMREGAWQGNGRGGSERVVSVELCPCCGSERSYDGDPVDEPDPPERDPAAVLRLLAGIAQDHGMTALVGLILKVLHPEWSHEKVGHWIGVKLPRRDSRGLVEVVPGAGAVAEAKAALRRAENHHPDLAKAMREGGPVVQDMADLVGLAGPLSLAMLAVASVHPDEPVERQVARVAGTALKVKEYVYLGEGQALSKQGIEQQLRSVCDEYPAIAALLRPTAGAQLVREEREAGGDDDAEQA